jgi:hypothetical protein
MWHGRQRRSVGRFGFDLLTLFLRSFKQVLFDIPGFLQGVDLGAEQVIVGGRSRGLWISLLWLASAEQGGEGNKQYESEHDSTSLLIV